MAVQVERRKTTRGRRATDTPPMDGKVEQRLRWNWIFVAGLAVASTFGLAATVVFARWPQESHHEIVLLSLMSMAVAAFIGYLTKVQNQFVHLRVEIDRIEMNALRQRYAQLSKLFGMSRIMGSDATPRSVLDGIAKMCLETFNCQKVTVMLVQKEAQYIEVMSAAGYADKKIIGARQKIGEGIAGWVAKHNKPVLIVDAVKDAKKYPGLSFKAKAISAAMVVPILADKMLIGVLNVSTQGDAYYDEEDLNNLRTFAANAGAWILHVKKSQKMKAAVQEMHAALQSRLSGEPSGS